MRHFLTILSLFLVLGCQSSSTQVEKAGSKTDLQAVALNSFDGTYVFDADAYLRDQKAYEDSILKEMQAEDIEKMMKIFKPYKVELSGEMATASFAYDVIQGRLNKGSGNASRRGAEFEMVPVESDKKSQIVKLIIDGESLILDPGKSPRDRMNFKRVQ